MPASAVQLGQATSSTSGPASITNEDYFQTGVAAGNSYMVPADGTITQWATTSTTTTAGSGQSATLKIFRFFSPGNFYTVVAHDGPHTPLTQGQLNIFNVNIPVLAGDFIGLNGANINIINSASASDTILQHGPPGLNDGQTAPFFSGTNALVNLQATFVPTPPATPAAVPPPTTPVSPKKKCKKKHHASAAKKCKKKR